MGLPEKLKKTSVKPALPPKTAIFRRKLTFTGNIRRIFKDNDPIFFCKFLELNVPIRKTGETAAVQPLPPKTATCRQNLFLSFLAELDISESFETNLFFSKKILLVFVFDTFL